MLSSVGGDLRRMPKGGGKSRKSWLTSFSTTTDLRAPARGGRGSKGKAGRKHFLYQER